jgi:hypothetical protein
MLREIICSSNDWSLIVSESIRTAWLSACAIWVWIVACCSSILARCSSICPALLGELDGDARRLRLLLSLRSARHEQKQGGHPDGQDGRPLFSYAGDHSRMSVPIDRVVPLWPAV